MKKLLIIALLCVGCDQKGKQIKTVEYRDSVIKYCLASSGACIAAGDACIKKSQFFLADFNPHSDSFVKYEQIEAYFARQEDSLEILQDYYKVLSNW